MKTPSRVARNKRLRRTILGPSLPRRCSAISDQRAQAKKMLGFERWGPILGTGYGSVETQPYRVEATKRPFAGLFGKPLADSNRRPLSYHGGGH
jgi:hypothetical protein